MYPFHIILLVAASASVAVSDGASQATPATQPSTVPQSQPQPVYQPQDPVTGYVPHATYPYADTYGPAPGYEGYLVPAVGSQYSAPHGDYVSSIVPSAKGALHVTLKVLAKIGLFLLGGVALLIVGGVFTTAVCSLTPLCTITFAGFHGINKDAMRAYVTPERVANAAAFVGNAVDKYQRLQRTVDGQY